MVAYRPVRPEAVPRGCSSMAEHQLPKLIARVRFPSPALRQNAPEPIMVRGVRAISVPLANGHQHASRAAVILVIVAAGGLDVSVDRAGYALVGSLRLMHVDHGRPFAVVAHPGHQILDSSTAAGRAVSRELVYPYAAGRGSAGRPGRATGPPRASLRHLPRARNPALTTGQAVSLDLCPGVGQRAPGPGPCRSARGLGLTDNPPGSKAHSWTSPK
jgi:hypothetical protein